VFGLARPTHVLATQYPRHTVTRNFDSISVFPGAAGIKEQAAESWQAQPLVRTNRRAWLESGRVQGEVRFQQDEDRKGPVTLALALSRQTGDSKSGTDGSRPSAQGDSGGSRPDQRMVVTTDSDFLSNAHLGNAGNQQLGLNLVHWLTADEAFINVQLASAPGTSLNLPGPVAWGIPIVFLGLIPLLLIAAGTTIWLQRRRL
jgi:hypothetical protein